ncbi:hypothetical protein [Amycolatopsis jiangsuensis]|uniref:Membrane protease subunit (Stomatin/prohibitin family) n=1 Tax=Amycolatopsis jiangsuensis TaxID=1181879 RepID=A0A840J6R1_9PSEU|nr:hypothetical protein [Amycolatopsis jiangsuensis]MBB4689077.1 membrane protease subunit (stomatin/prohibitin family) [Amycolatopsis jiangsuensis]
MTSMEMDPSGTRSAANGIAAAGSDFGGAWAAAQGTVTGLSGGLGQGLLGQAFMKGYRPAAEKLSQAATRISAGLKSAAEAGVGATTDYEAGDHGAAAAMPKSGR